MPNHCHLHGHYEGWLCPRCLMEIGSAGGIPMANVDHSTPVSFTGYTVETFSSPEEYQRAQDKAEVEAFIKSLDGVR